MLMTGKLLVVLSSSHTRQHSFPSVYVLCCNNSSK